MNGLSFLNRRLFVMYPAIDRLDSRIKKQIQINRPVNVEPDQLYVYETERFRTMFALSDDDGKCITFKQRVDWYDPITDKPKSFNEARVYITDIGGTN